MAFENQDLAAVMDIYRNTFLVAIFLSNSTSLVMYLLIHIHLNNNWECETLKQMRPKFQRLIKFPHTSSTYRDIQIFKNLSLPHPPTP